MPKEDPVKKTAKPKTAAKKTTTRKPKEKSPKDLATENGEPWVDIVKVELDPEHIGTGTFELDFNEIFVARLYKAGYQGKTDYDIVDQWFTDVCRNVVLETFEQEQADPERRAVNRRDIGDGKSEIS